MLHREATSETGKGDANGYYLLVIDLESMLEQQQHGRFTMSQAKMCI